MEAALGGEGDDHDDGARRRHDPRRGGHLLAAPPLPRSFNFLLSARFCRSVLQQALWPLFVDIFVSRPIATVRTTMKDGDAACRHILFLEA
jgi:hypothetical protein